MARPRQFDEQQVIESLMKVFWEKGYEASSMQDLVAASGLLKGSLYGAFGDKQTLYLMALRHYDRTRIQAGIDTQPSIISGNIKAVFLDVHELSGREHGLQLQFIQLPGQSVCLRR